MTGSSGATATVGLAFNPSTDTYTFDDSTGVTPGAVDAAFTYTQVTADEATLVPVNKVVRDFATLDLTPTVTSISYDLNSLGNATTITNAAGLADIVTVGDAATGLSGIAASVTLNNSAAGSSTNLTIDNAGGPALTSTLDPTSFTTTTPGTIGEISWTSASLTGLVVDAGSNSDTITIDGTPSGGATTGINAGTGGDTFNVLATTANSILDVGGAPSTANIGNAGSVQGIAGTLELFSPTTITVDDSADTTGRTVIVNSDFIGGLAPAAINYTDAVTSLTIDGGGSPQGGNTFTVLNTLPVGSTTTLNSGTGDDTVDVQATRGALNLHGQAGSDTVDLGKAGDMSGILDPITIDNVDGLTALTLDASAATASHTFTLTGGMTQSTFTNLSPGAITYTTSEISPLTIDTGPSGTQVMNIDFSNGNPIPSGTVPGLVFNAGANATSASGSHALNLMGTLPSGPFASEIHNANDQTVFPQVGQYGSIDFVDSARNRARASITPASSPSTTRAGASSYTFNDFGYPDQSFSASDGPVVGGFNTIQFTNTPTPSTPLNFETTNIANKTNVTFVMPPRLPAPSRRQRRGQHPDGLDRSGDARVRHAERRRQPRLFPRHATGRGHHVHRQFGRRYHQRDRHGRRDGDDLVAQRRPWPSTR